MDTAQLLLAFDKKWNFPEDYTYMYIDDSNNTEYVLSDENKGVRIDGVLYPVTQRVKNAHKFMVARAAAAKKLMSGRDAVIQRVYAADETNMKNKICTTLYTGAAYYMADLTHYLGRKVEMDTSAMEKVIYLAEFHCDRLHRALEEAKADNPNIEDLLLQADTAMCSAINDYNDAFTKLLCSDFDHVFAKGTLLNSDAFNRPYSKSYWKENLCSVPEDELKNVAYLFKYYDMDYEELVLTPLVESAFNTLLQQGRCAADLFYFRLLYRLEGMTGKVKLSDVPIFKDRFFKKFAMMVQVVDEIESLDRLQHAMEICVWFDPVQKAQLSVLIAECRNDMQ